MLGHVILALDINYLNLLMPVLEISILDCIPTQCS